MNFAGRSSFWKLYGFYVQFSVRSASLDRPFSKLVAFPLSLLHAYCGSVSISMTVIIYHVQARSAKLGLIIRRDVYNLLLPQS
ncbi:hypothetical protein MtrunA17_Chr5g0445241 [Medicago truncatula]|nr:hypothetical protein MtrunA17_Chr5g0445241 [Medicago truncatula]